MKHKVMSFRASQEDLDRLADIAKKKKMSVSALLSQIIKSYLEWEYLARDIGMMPVHKGTLRGLVDSLDEDRLKQLAVSSADSFMEHMLVLAGENSLSAFIRITMTRAEKSGFVVTESTIDGKIQLVIHHGLGRKWSVFFSTFHERVLANLGYRAEVEVSENTKVIRVPIPPA